MAKQPAYWRAHGDVSARRGQPEPNLVEDLPQDGHDRLRGIPHPVTQGGRKPRTDDGGNDGRVKIGRIGPGPLRDGGGQLMLCTSIGSKHLGVNSRLSKKPMHAGGPPLIRRLVARPARELCLNGGDKRIPERLIGGPLPQRLGSPSPTLNMRRDNSFSLAAEVVAKGAIGDVGLSGNVLNGHVLPPPNNRKPNSSPTQREAGLTLLTLTQPTVPIAHDNRLAKLSKFANFPTWKV